MSIAPTERTKRRAQRQAEPDLIDRMVALLVREAPELQARVTEIERVLRDEFAGIETYVRRRQRPASALAVEILARFNGRNVSQTARELQISRATVYRALRQPGGSD